MRPCAQGLPLPAGPDPAVGRRPADPSGDAAAVGLCGREVQQIRGKQQEREEQEQEQEREQEQEQEEEEEETQRQPQPQQQQQCTTGSALKRRHGAVQ